MGKKLKLIIESLASGDKRFIKDNLNRILEVDDSGNQKFTGYYAGDNDTVYTSRAWSKKLIAKKKEAQRERLDIFEQEQEEALQKRKKKTLFMLLGFTVIIIGTIAIVYATWNNNDPSKTEPPMIDKIEPTPMSEFATTTTDSLYGNAIITGSDVNMREKPNLNADIIDFFPKEGERVMLLLPASDTLSWCKVTRKDGTTGWIYSEYVKKMPVSDE
ncbi:SH3 domain-containing protein [Dokdonia sinensis]|uniref:SH3 domain-containing protein n=1 Tax=Dokdonia sinensis TaxID=2479847 RepID=A0A3M0GUE9_9FLAO|nr:SH3 domain-containing protein [Dokdonia sinensis]RMB60946.1 SH3 domain-containing protein [Dokdonia sinensis]